MKFVIDIPDNILNSSGIYKISNNKNDMLYIGRTKNFKKRAYRHKESFNNGLCNSKIRSFIEQNSDVVFSFFPILETNDIKSEEEKYIEKYNACEKGFNILKNDEEFTEFLRNNKHKFKHIKPKKTIYVTEQEKLLLEKGYIRDKKTNKLNYNPNKAKSILKKCGIISPKVIKKTKIRDILDFSDLVRK